MILVIQVRMDHQVVLVVVVNMEVLDLRQFNQHNQEILEHMDLDFLVDLERAILMRAAVVVVPVLKVLMVLVVK